MFGFSIISVLFFLVSLKISFAKEIEECNVECEVVKMSDTLIPSEYNSCICFSKASETMHIRDKQKCFPTYRSLKFREKTTGMVVLHRAVVASCLGQRLSSQKNVLVFEEQKIVNQTVFDNQEKEFQQLRNYHIGFPVQTNRSQPSRSYQYNNEFRLNIMQLFKKPDGHLRFG